MSSRPGIASRADFWGRVPLRTRLTFFGAVFFVFAPLGILGISSFAQNRPWIFFVVYGSFSGLTAAGFAYAFTRNRKFFWIVAPSQVLWSQLHIWVPGATAALSFEGLGTVASIVIGYVLFIKFIAGEGARRFRLETEMRLAQQIHTSLIPPIARTTRRWDLFGVSLPSSEMGGDLLDVVETDHDLGVYIADVSGHGVRAGVVMGMVKSAMRMKLRESHGLDELLNDLNHVMCELVEPGMFVTCAFLRSAENGAVQFAGAGHGPVLHYHRAGGSLRALDSEHLPLGISRDEKYAARTVACGPGDLFLFMTDGLTEVFDRHGRQLGQGPIEAVFTQNAHRSLSEIHAAILETVNRHGPRADDQTLLLVRVREVESSVP